MPFSKDNIKFTTLLIGVLVLCLMIILGIVLVARTPNPSPALYASVVGFPSTIVLQLLQMLRAEQHHKETRRDVKGAIAPMADNVNYVAQKLENGGKPLQVSRDELRQMIAEVREDVRREERARRPAPDARGEHI